MGSHEAAKHLTEQRVRCVHWTELVEAHGLTPYRDQRTLAECDEHFEGGRGRQKVTLLKTDAEGHDVDIVNE